MDAGRDQKIDFFDGCYESYPNSNRKLMTLKNSRYKVDEALEYHLNQIDDWSIFGSFGFRYKASLERLKFCFYKLIRAVERNNRGQFVVKFEGDNRAREMETRCALNASGLACSETDPSCPEAFPPRRACEREALLRAASLSSRNSFHEASIRPMNIALNWVTR